MEWNGMANLTILLQHRYLVLADQALEVHLHSVGQPPTTRRQEVGCSVIPPTTTQAAALADLARITTPPQIPLLAGCSGIRIGLDSVTTPAQDFSATVGIMLLQTPLDHRATTLTACSAQHRQVQLWVNLYQNRKALLPLRFKLIQRKTLLQAMQPINFKLSPLCSLTKSIRLK